MPMVFRGVVLSLTLLGSVIADAADVLERYDSTDTLNPGEDSNPDAQNCLDGLCWEPEEFKVEVTTAEQGRGDFLVRFPSPRPTGNDVNDLVALEWYAVFDEAGNPVRGPAVIVVHESGSGMTVGRLFAQGFRQRGIHAFMLQLPNYGLRRIARHVDAANMLPALKQGIADTRRARDAVRVLPAVDSDKIALQGTSLGGFVASTSGAIDAGFQPVFLTLSGGDIYSVIKQGKKDAAKVRERLEAAGVDDGQLREMTQAIEPNRVAHRLRAETTFIYSGLYDEVVPLANAESLASKIGLAADHHTKLPSNHYTGVVFMPVILDHMATQIMGRPVKGPAAVE
ncbi:MAG: hypothetical protein R3C18_08945 [Planctomycetaceae bacterium]